MRKHYASTPTPTTMQDWTQFSKKESATPSPRRNANPLVQRHTPASPPSTQDTTATPKQNISPRLVTSHRRHPGCNERRFLSHASRPHLWQTHKHRRLNRRSILTKKKSKRRKKRNRRVDHHDGKEECKTFKHANNCTTPNMAKDAPSDFSCVLIYVPLLFCLERFSLHFYFLCYISFYDYLF